MKKASFETILREHGCKVTPARVAVLDALSSATKPMSAAQILDVLGAKDYDQVTVYRTVQTLTDSGLLKKIDFQHGISYYELSSLGDHHHAVCVNCQAVQDVDVCIDNLERNALKQSGFSSILRHSLEFFGLCKRCAK